MIPLKCPTLRPQAWLRAAACESSRGRQGGKAPKPTSCTVFPNPSLTLLPFSSHIPPRLASPSQCSLDPLASCRVLAVSAPQSRLGLGHAARLHMASLDSPLLPWSPLRWQTRPLHALPGLRPLRPHLEAKRARAGVSAAAAGAAAEKGAGKGSGGNSSLKEGNGRNGGAARGGACMGEGEGGEEGEQQAQQEWGVLEQRLAAVRSAMQQADGGKGVDAFIVPSEDPHKSEYSAACFERRHFISGFTGSAGTAVVTHSQALLWTDGRYFLQAGQQLGKQWELIKAGLPGVPTVAEWLADTLPPGSRIGLDPFVHSAESVDVLRDAVEDKGCVLVMLPQPNLVDVVWGHQRPSLPAGRVRVHGLEYAGRSVQEKVGDMQGAMRDAGASLLVVTMLDEVAWLFNIRGADVPHCPVVLAYAVVTLEGAHLFVEESKLGEEARQHLAQAQVTLHPYSALLPFLVKATKEGETVWMDPEKVSAALFSAFFEATGEPGEGAKRKDKKKTKKGKSKAKHKGEQAEEPAGPGLVTLPCPVDLPKACKNAAEIEGMRQAHIRDAAAVVQFLEWVEREIGQGRVLTEVEVGVHLEAFRRLQPGFLDTSFDTIAGADSNGAIIHYRAEEGKCRSVGPGQMLLLDSGGQYVDGTTDITRTMHFGTPSQYQRTCFTRVLQGHIGLDSAVFPEGTPGFVLDTLARRSLWQIGLDYRHGTGHGVGACLNVHEGPHSISPRFGNPTPLQPGMVVSNEPGFYHDGCFGIRIENLLVVREEPTEHRFGGLCFYGFDRLTLVPIQAKLIELSLLTQHEIDWVDAYHTEVWDKVSPLLSGRAMDWLWTNTRPLVGAVQGSRDLVEI